MIPISAIRCWQFEKLKVDSWYIDALNQAQAGLNENDISSG